MNERSEGPRRRMGRWVAALGVAIAAPGLLGLRVVDDPVVDGRGSGGDPDAHRAFVVVPPRSTNDLIADAEWRARSVEIEGARLEDFYAAQVAPLVHDLTRLKDDPGQATLIAIALVREGLRANLDPSLLLAVMSVENPSLDLGALSPAGAVGLMQVMPFHAGGWGCEGDDLTDLDINVCHGAKILAHALERVDGDVPGALLRYNGCVVGTSTSDCHLYPSWVFRYAARAWANDPVVRRDGAQD